MARRGRKKYFSIIFVPDQEQEPISISMSYLKGKWLLVLAAVFCIHLITGGFAYYKIVQLEKTKQTLTSSNTELVARNKRIEIIAQEFQDIRVTGEKIRKAFGSSLGLTDDEKDVLNDIPLRGRVEETHVPQQIPYTEKYGRASSSQAQSGLYFLTKSQASYYDPDYLPTMLPVEGFLTTHFQKGGWYIGRSHYGIDIAAKKGTVIRAAGAGVVLVSNWTPDFGNIVVISHGHGLFSYYAHAMHVLVRQGFEVKRGQPIALLGSSGISSAPHLHFEIWKDGKPLDPEDIIYALPRQEPAEG